jgi:hypothetical protein
LPPVPDHLEAAADQAVAACGADAREAVKALLVSNGFLEEQVRKMQAAVSTGYSRRMFETLRDRKDWSD